MADNELIISDVHDEVAVAQLRDRVIAYNIAVTGYDDGRSLSCYVRGDDGELIVDWFWRRTLRPHSLSSESQEWTLVPLSAIKAATNRETAQ